MQETEKVDARSSRNILEVLRRNEIARQTRQAADSVSKHAEYIGKCYVKDTKPHYSFLPSAKKYYKVISNHSTNESRISMLTFYEHPYYWFNHSKSRAGGSANGIFGNFEFDGIRVEDFPFFCYAREGGLEKDFLTEITPEEYGEAMYRYIQELVNLEWKI